jgi:hypothetical protein
VAKSIEEFQARAEACRAEAAAQPLDRVRQVQLEAATRWETLAEQARWIPDAEDQAAGASSVPARRRMTARPVPRRISVKPGAIETSAFALASPPMAEPDALKAPPPILRLCEIPSPLQHAEGPADFAPSAFDKAEPETILPALAGGDLNVAVLAADGHFRTLEEIEADIIRSALAFYRGRVSKVARRLGIGRSTLYRKMLDFGIENSR